MKWVLGSVVLGIGLAFSSGASGANTSPAVGQLDQIKTEFIELSGHMPYGSIPGADAQATREAYTNATATLTEGITAYASEREDTRAYLLAAYNQYRVVGLLVPFYAINKEMRLELMQRYLRNLDRLAIVINTLAKPTAPPTTTSAPWYSGGAVWIHLGKMQHATGLAECPKQKAERAGVFHLAKFSELAVSFRDMKKAETNQAFGTKAANFERVWMLEASEIKPGEFNFLNFREEGTGNSPGTEAYEVLCVADEAA